MSHQSTRSNSDSSIIKTHKDGIEFFEDDLIQIDVQQPKLIHITVKSTTEPLTDLDFTYLNSLSTKLETFNQKNKASGIKSYMSLDKIFASKPIHLMKTQAEVVFEGTGQLAVKYIASFLTNFKKLTALKLVLNDEKATDKSLFSVASLINSLKPRFKELYLDFSGCRITDEGLFALSDSIRDQTRLKQLQLIFKSSQKESKITDHGIIALTDILKSCPKIEGIKFEFKNSSEITNVGLNAFLNNIKGIKTLKELVLNFEGCQINDEALNHTSDFLIQSRDLRLFGLFLTEMGSIRFEAINNLVGGIKLLKKSETIYLRLNGKLENENRLKINDRIADLSKSIKAINRHIEVGCREHY